MMRRREQVGSVWLVVAAAVDCVCAGCSVTVGSGPVRSESRQVAGFSVVPLAGHARHQGRAAITTTEPITDKVGVQALAGLELSGSGTISAAGRSGADLRVEISGSGSMQVGGSADRQDVEVSGSGDHSAASLASKEASVTISGSGSVSRR